MKNMKLKNKEGITLIALIITVIIMLILAAITIGAVTGDGLFTRTKKTADAYENAAQNEADIIGGLLDDLDKIQGVVVDDPDPGNLGGAGTENDPYRLESIEDLVAFSNATNGIGTAENRVVTDRTYNKNNVNKYEDKYVKLVCHLDFESDNSYMDPERKDFGDINGDGTIDELKKELTTKEGTGFLPVGFQVDGFSSAVKAFQGVFEGNNKEIANVYVNQPNMSKDGKGYYCTGGIFGYVNNATIKNLTVSGNVVISSKVSTIYSSDIIGIGGIVGIAETSTLEKLNNKVQMETKVGAIGIEGEFGGIVGRLANSTIKDSENNSSILGRNFGGIVGQAGSSLIDTSINNGKITHCVNNSSFTVGGSGAGIVYKSSCLIENCVNNGDLSNIESSGIVRDISNANIEKCTNNGNFSNINTGVFCAGIASNVYNGNVVECINKGEINISENVNYAGGCVAKIEKGEINSCKNEGKIHYSGEGIGGIVGTIETTTIQNCENYGEIIGRDVAGGIAGHNGYDGDNIIDNCKNFNLVSGINNCAGIIGYASLNIIISNCVNSGNIQAIAESEKSGNVRAAGIVAVGDCEKIENCCNLADIYSYSLATSSPSASAGIVCVMSSHEYSIINNCYNTGNIKGEGLIITVSSCGIMEEFMYARGDIYNCYNTGNIEAVGKRGVAYGISGLSEGYGIYNTYNLGELTGNETRIYEGYDYINAPEQLVKNVFTKETYSIGKPSDIRKLFNVYNEKEFYSADGTYSSSRINLKSQEFVNTLNSFVDDYNSNVAEGGIILKRWKIDNSVEESQGYPIFE